MSNYKDQHIIDQWAKDKTRREAEHEAAVAGMEKWLKKIHANEQLRRNLKAEVDRSINDPSQRSRFSEDQAGFNLIENEPPETGFPDDRPWERS